MTWNRLIGTVLSLATIASQGACTMRDSAVWLEPGSTAENIVFGIGAERGGTAPISNLNYVAVRTCDSAAVAQQTRWQVRGEVQDGERPPARISYGVVPRGFSEEHPAEPLGPGCYEVLVSGHGISASVRFAIQPNGRIIEEPENLVSGS